MPRMKSTRPTRFIDGRTLTHCSQRRSPYPRAIHAARSPAAPGPSVVACERHEGDTYSVPQLQDCAVHRPRQRCFLRPDPVASAVAEAPWCAERSGQVTACFRLSIRCPADRIPSQSGTPRNAPAPLLPTAASPSGTPLSRTGTVDESSTHQVGSMDPVSLLPI